MVSAVQFCPWAPVKTSDPTRGCNLAELVLSAGSFGDHHTRITRRNAVRILFVATEGHGHDAGDPVLDINAVCAISSLSKSTVKRLVRRGDFPQPLKLSANRIGWRLSTLKLWLDHRGSQRNPSPDQKANARYPAHMTLAELARALGRGDWPPSVAEQNEIMWLLDQLSSKAAARRFGWKHA